MPQPVATIVIIFLNDERYLQEAIDSVARQTFADWELVLIDDGSTDKSSAGDD
jgi:glycosyltransferase involved in cell wall biosynthesis